MPIAIVVISTDGICATYKKTSSDHVRQKWRNLVTLASTDTAAHIDSISIHFILLVQAIPPAPLPKEEGYR